MKILLIVPKYNLSLEPEYNYAFPLGLAYISSTLKKAGYDVDILNMNHYSGSVEELIKLKLNSKRYDIVGTGGNALIYSLIEKIVFLVKNHPTKPLIIVGGPIITSEPELMISLLNPDFAVIGEGEITICELLKCLKSKKDPKDIQGLIYFNKDGKIIKTSPREFIGDLEKIPYPDFESFGFKEKLDNTFCNLSFCNNCLDFPRTYFVLGSRGCPFNCSFCWHDTKYRSRSIKDIIKEIKWAIKEYRINNILIYDDCFSSTQERVYSFCKEITKLSKNINCKIRWTCQLLVNNVDLKMLKVMKEAGCEFISYGFESYHIDVLKSMRKPITPEQINKAFKETLNAKIGIQANFILGDIAETKETAEATINYWKNVCKGQIGLGFVEPYPGSDLYKYCLQKNIIKDKTHYIKNQMSSDNAIKMTSKMSEEEFAKLRKNVLEYYSKYIKFVRPIYLKKTGIKNKVYDLGVKCPFCFKKQIYKNCFIENLFTYGFHLTCRNCAHRFFVVSSLQKLAYRHYSKIRTIRDNYKKIKKRIKNKIL